MTPEQRIAARKKMDRWAAQLDCKVEAVNRANEVANALFAQMHAIFKPLAGQKICKVDGTFLKRVAELLPPSDYPDDKHPKPTVMYYRNRVGDYSVSFTVKVCAYNGHEGCHYAERTVYICDLRDGVIPDDARWYDAPNHRTDFTVDEVKQLREDYRTKRDAYESARGKLGDWGEHDN